MCDNNPRLSDAIDIVLVRVGVLRLSTECRSYFLHICRITFRTVRGGSCREGE